MSDTASLPPWVLVCGGFHRLGGMDRANLALAEVLLEQGREVYLVGHDIDPTLQANPNVRAIVVPKRVGVLLGESALRREGMRIAADVTRRWPEARVVVNGGNCPWPDINWVHCVHAAWPRFDEQAPLWFRAKSRINKQKARADERYALRRAKLVIANSERTRRDLIAIGIPEEKIQVIYLGCEPDWQPATLDQRAEARRSFDLPQGAVVVSFVGALGYDRNKGFDTLLAAWKEARLPNAILVAAGAGRGFGNWHREVERLGLQDTVRLLGFTDRVGELLAASDLFVSPVRYEAFGLNVLEALCRGVPAIVSKAAGVAELYPKELSRWLLQDPDEARPLAQMLAGLLPEVHAYHAAFAAAGAELRKQTMHDTAAAIVAAAEHHRRLNAAQYE